MVVDQGSPLEYEISARNERIEAYFKKQAAYEDARDLVLRLMVPLQPRQQDTMAKIETLLEELDGYFDELGYLGDGGTFDHESYRRLQIIRRIADGKIRVLDDVPEALRAQYEDAFTEGARTEDGHWVDGDWHRETEVIQDELEACREEFQVCVGPTYGLNAREGFEEYLVGIKKVPEILELLIENLNNVWFDYKNAAAAVGNHF
jgi:hypothetical protein